MPGTPVSPKLQGLPLLLRHHCTACAACALFLGGGLKNDRCSILVEVQMKIFKVFPCSCHCTAPASALGWVGLESLFCVCICIWIWILNLILATQSFPTITSNAGGITAITLASDRPSHFPTTLHLSDRTFPLFLNLLLPLSINPDWSLFTQISTIPFNSSNRRLLKVK